MRQKVNFIYKIIVVLRTFRDILIFMEQEKKKGCKSCKDKGNFRFGMMAVLGGYIFLTSIYGNIILIEKLITYLKSVF